jgi:hypothetical protein
MKIRSVSISMALPCVVVASLALLGCPEEGGKSPFATENVSVAPQVDGRAPAPTPIPPPPAEAAAPESE